MSVPADTCSPLRAARERAGVRLAFGIDVPDLPPDLPTGRICFPAGRLCTPDELSAGYAYGTHCALPLVGYAHLPHLLRLDNGRGNGSRWVLSGHRAIPIGDRL